MHEELQRHNRRATVLLLAAGFLLLFLLGLAVQYLLFGFAGGSVPTTLASTVPMLGFAGVMAGVGTATAWWSSDQVALRASGAVPADPSDFRDYHRLVEGLCLAAGLPKPRLYIIDDPAPNAFATGRNPEKAAVAVTTGLLDRMERRELEAVLAHELGHIRNNDLLTVTIAVTLAGAAVLLGEIARRALWFGGGSRRRRSSQRDSGGGAVAIVLLVASIVVILLAPLAAQLIRFAVSRQREYLADATSVELTRDPAAMIRALRRLADDTTEVQVGSKATAHLWIEEPVRSHARGARSTATHPPLEDRIARLGQLWPDALHEVEDEVRRAGGALPPSASHAPTAPDHTAAPPPPRPADTGYFVPPPDRER